MISKLLRLTRTSSNSGTSHSRSTICVCSNLMTPGNFSISIIRPMSCSFSASYTDGIVSSPISGSISGIHLRQNYCEIPWYPNFSVPDRVQWFQTFQTSQFLQAFYTLKRHQASCRSPHLCKHLACVSSTYSQPQPVNQVTYLLLFAYLQTSCRSSHLSKHLTCVSRTHSQPQPVEIYSSISKKTCCFRQSIDKSLSSNDLTANMPKKVKQKHVTWIKNTQALRCPWLYNSNVPTQCQLQILSTSSTQISRKPRSSIQTISASP